MIFTGCHCSLLHPQCPHKACHHTRLQHTGDITLARTGVPDSTSPPIAEWHRGGGCVHQSPWCCAHILHTATLGPPSLAGGAPATAWTFWWWFKDCRWRKLLLQPLHWKGLCWVCRRWCSSSSVWRGKLDFSLKLFPQAGHWKGRSPVCRRWSEWVWNWCPQALGEEACAQRADAGHQKQHPSGRSCSCMARGPGLGFPRTVRAIRLMSATPGD
uniref:Uncharacterized protein n=1 Tax=Coturnix japonica TaxID=93934 RepID=A0A8C2T941_COTJA